MKCYKGFDKDLRCKGFQYEIGKEYQEDSAELCEKGFHACENPIDVFTYYSPKESRYCEVELDDISDETKDDSKRVGKRIRIGAEIGIKGIVDAFVQFTFDRVDWKNKNASNTGFHSVASNTGDRSAASNTGFRSVAEVSGKYSVAIAVGYDCRARASIGSAICLAERSYNGKLLHIKSAIIDGKKLKADVWYKLVNGKFVEDV